MQLHQQVVFENEFTPGVPGHTTMCMDLTLKEVIAAGKVTNPYQLFVLGYLAEFFKKGFKSVDLQLEGPTMYGVDATTTAVKEAVSSLSDTDHVVLAQYLLDCIEVGESLLHDEKMNVVEWMKFVLRKQD